MMPRIPGRPSLDLSGKWAVVELPTMMSDYLELSPDPHVQILHKEADRFRATFQFGAQQGEIDGRVDEVWPDAAQLFFTFTGMDEGDEFRGASADAAYHAKTDTIDGTMRYHNGDNLPFVWRRLGPPHKKMTARKRIPRKKTRGIR